MKIWTVVGLSFVLLGGCASKQAAQPLPFFPQVAPQPPGLEEIWLTAAFEGRLVVENGCVKVRSPKTQQGSTVLWYQGIELDRDRFGLFLRSSHTGNVTRFNTPVKFGGGAVSEEYIERDYPEVARRCGPPYFFGYPADD
jgi:hypothetical protein